MELFSAVKSRLVLTYHCRKQERCVTCFQHLPGAEPVSTGSERGWWPGWLHQECVLAAG
jgi:hypothetical protein